MSQGLTLEQFVERFERPRIPVVITGLTDAWPAQQAWTPTALRARYGEHRFKVTFGCHLFLFVVITGLTDAWSAQQAWIHAERRACYGKHHVKVRSMQFHR